jgi:C-terminal peptidase prc
MNTTVRSSLFCLALALPAPLLPGGSASASVVATSTPSALPQDEDAGARLEAALAAASGQTLEDAFATLGALAQLDPDLRPALDKALDARLATSADPRTTLLLASARLAGEDLDTKELAKLLRPILSGGDEGLAVAAARTLADRAFKTMGDEEKEELGKELGATAKDPDRAGRLRITAAVALHGLGRAEFVRDARGELVAFLGSSDGQLSAQAALALAEVGDLETPRDALARLARRPDATGALAAAYLKQEDIRRLYDRRQKNLLDYTKKQVEGVELSGKSDLKLIENVIRLIETSALEGDKVKRKDLVDAALDGMLRSLDEHSSYLTSEEFKKNFAEDLLEPQYGGIGAYVGEDPEDKLFTIRQPIYSGPAYRAGLHSDDKVVRIEDWPTFDNKGCKPTDEIIKRLKGKPGTPVKLYIWRRGMDASLIDRPSEDMAVEIVREQITIPPVKADLLPGGVALLELASFTSVASEELEKALSNFKSQGLQAVVLDLRQNTGGLLEEARNVAGLFLPKKTLVVSTESRIDETQRLYTQREPLVGPDVPLVVLVSRYSASASEIVAGAMQDTGRGLVVGQRTFGKGSVQTLAPVPGERNDEYKDENGNGRHDTWEALTKDYNGNGEFDYAPRARLTIAKYLLPSGRSIHRELDEEGKLASEGGVVPDEKVDPERFDAAVIEEMRKVRQGRKLREWLDQRWKDDPALYTRLAECDEDRPENWPGFDELQASLDTTLDRDSLRYLLRLEARGRAQDSRGAAFPDGDFQEDPQLQKAIELLLAKLGSKPADIPQYASTFDEVGAKVKKPLALALSDDERSNLQNSLLWLEGERAKSASVDPRLDGLTKALKKLLDR